MVNTGSVTIHGSTGSSVGITFTSGNDVFGLALASTFQSLTAQLASSGSQFYQYMGSSFLAFENNTGPVIIPKGPSGASTLLGGDGTEVGYFGPSVGSASAVIDIGGGSSFISTGIGVDTVAVGGNGSVVLVGNSATVHGGGDNQIIIGGQGSNDIFISGAGDTVGTSEKFGAQTTVDASAASNPYIYGATNTSITGASGSLTTIDQSGGVFSVNAGAGGTSYDQQNGTLRFYGASGGNETITNLGGSSDSIYAASGTNITFVGTGNNYFVANQPTPGDNGPVSVNAALTSGNNQFWAGSGNATLIGGVGSDTLVGGSGKSTLTGGSGAANQFDLFSSAGGSGTNITITDFGSAAGNYITLFSYGTSSTAIASQGQQPNNDSYQISLKDGSTITLLNTTSLDPSKIIITPSNVS